MQCLNHWYEHEVPLFELVFLLSRHANKDTFSPLSYSKNLRGCGIEPLFVSIQTIFDLVAMLVILQIRGTYDH